MLTCEAKVLEAEHGELRGALDDEVDLRRWELVAIEVERGESCELGNGPRQGCRHELGYCWHYVSAHLRFRARRDGASRAPEAAQSALAQLQAKWLAHNWYYVTRQLTVQIALYERK